MEHLSEADKGTLLKIVEIFRADQFADDEGKVEWARREARQLFESWRAGRIDAGEAATREAWSLLVIAGTREVVEEGCCLEFHAEQYKFHGGQREHEEAEGMELEAARLASNLELLKQHVGLLKGLAILPSE